MIPAQEETFGLKHVGVDHVDLCALLDKAIAGLLQHDVSLVVTPLSSEHPPKQRAAECDVVFRTRRSPYADRFTQRDFSFLDAALIEENLGDVAVRHRHVRHVTQTLNELPGLRVEGHRVVPTAVEVRAVANLCQHSGLTCQITAALVQAKRSTCSASVNRMPQVHINYVENRQRVRYDRRSASG